MTARVTVTAGPHDVGFTFRERPLQPQDVWQPALRDSQEIHMIGGLPKLKTVGMEGPYNVTGVSTTPSRERVFVCRPDARLSPRRAVWRPDRHRSAAANARTASEAACANRILTTSRGAPTGGR